MYKVVVRPVARVDVLEVAGYIGNDSSAMAKRWVDKYKNLLRTIGENPFVFSMATDLDTDQPVRTAHIYSHLVYFTVLEQEGAVLILRVLHGARRTPRPEDLFG